MKCASPTVDSAHARFLCGSRNRRFIAGSYELPEQRSFRIAFSEKFGIPLQADEKRAIFIFDPLDRPVGGCGNCVQSLAELINTLVMEGVNRQTV